MRRMTESNYPDWCRDSSERRRISRCPDKAQAEIIREDVEWEIEELRARLDRLLEMLEMIDDN